MTRSFAPSAGALLLVGAVPAIAVAQGSFVTPPASTPSPPPKPKPKPKQPLPAAKKAVASTPPVNAATATTKPASKPAAAPVAVAKPAERPRRVHSTEPVRAVAGPPPPPQPTLPAGPVQVAQADGSLLVGGQRVILAGLALRPTPDLDQRLGSWLSRNGNGVQCVPQGTGYACRTPYGLDLGTALVISGFATPLPDAVEGLRALGTVAERRAVALTTNPSTAVTALLAGTANPSCQNPFGCRIAYIAAGYNRNNTAYARQDWAGLAEGIVRTNYQNDINYYFLGRAAEELGAYRAAVVYFQKADALTQSYNANDRCSSLQGLPACDGINLAAELPSRINNAERAASYDF